MDEIKIKDIGNIENFKCPIAHKCPQADCIIKGKSFIPILDARIDHAGCVKISCYSMR